MGNSHGLEPHESYEAQVLRQSFGASDAHGTRDASGTFAAHTMSFPHALGTGIIVQSAENIDDEHVTAVDINPEAFERLKARYGLDEDDACDMIGSLDPADVTVEYGPYHLLKAFIDDYEHALSRFRHDSTLSAMRSAEHGGSFDFPDWAGPLFDLYDVLVHATDGAIDPCVGEDLIRLGYDARYSFRLSPNATAGTGTGHPAETATTADAGASGSESITAGTAETETDITGWNLGAAHGRATWRDDVERRGPLGTTLVTRRPVSLDFGACGKGYLVDLLAQRLAAQSGTTGGTTGSTTGTEGKARTGTATPYVIDAGGDLLVYSPGNPLTIALEDPADAENAVGTAEVEAGAFCASAPSRRHWEAAGHRLHHLLNAVDGLPANGVAATWVYVDAGAVAFPTALADGVATALFVTPPNRLHERLADYSVSHSVSSDAAHVTAPDYAAFECAVLNADRTAVVSAGFPGSLFTA